MYLNEIIILTDAKIFDIDIAIFVSVNNYSKQNIIFRNTLKS